MTTPMSEESIVNNFLENPRRAETSCLPDDNQEEVAWLRNSLHSYAAWVIARGRPLSSSTEWKEWGDKDDPASLLTGAENQIRSHRALAYNVAIENYASAMRKLIE